jgi:hypothetical protein
LRLGEATPKPALRAGDGGCVERRREDHGGRQTDPAHGGSMIAFEGCNP